MTTQEQTYNPTRQQVEAAIKNHFETWNRGDKEGWMANFAEDFVAEDPVGGLLKTGRQANEDSWENSFKNGHSWKLEATFMQICTNKAALLVKNIGKVNDEPVEFESIEIWAVNGEGKIYDIRVYFNPAEGDEVDPYFQQLSR
jgi:ketosteroid isomerase-like protein